MPGRGSGSRPRPEHASIRLPQVHPRQVASPQPESPLCRALLQRPAAPQEPEALSQARRVERATAPRVGLPPREEMRVRALVEEMERAAPRVPEEG